MRTDVLIADGDSQLCVIYERMFSGAGLLVETASDGLDCWYKIRARCPDALFVNMELLWGGSDGVLARLREDSDIAESPEIFVTGDDPPEVLAKRARIAVARCFQKPLELKMVLNSMCEVFAT